MPHRKSLLVLFVVLSLAPTVLRADAGVCVKLCSCQEWGTCGMGSGGSGGRGIFSGPTPEEREAIERRWRLYQEYKTKKKARREAAKGFEGRMKGILDEADDYFDHTERGVDQVLAPKGKAFGALAGRSLGAQLNPSATDIQLAGIELSRPIAAGGGQVSNVAFEGLKRFAAILNYQKEHNTLSTPDAMGSLEDMHYLLSEGAAHMSGHRSRVRVLMNSDTSPSEASTTVEAFRASWGRITAKQEEIRDSENNRLDVAKKAMKEQTKLEKIEKDISEEKSDKRREKLEHKRIEQAEKLRALKETSYEAKQQEQTATEEIAKEAKKITSCLEGATCE